jgi:hypothetical protein
MRANPWACLAATWAPSSGRISGGRLSRSSLVPLRPFGEPAQFRQPAGELGTSVDGVHRTYLDSGPGGLLPGALARHSSENSCSMSLAPAGRTRRPCAAAPWVSSRSSWARICFSSASETRLRLTYSPQPGHVPMSPVHEKRQPQKHATSISDCLPRPAVVPAGASFGL